MNSNSSFEEDVTEELINGKPAAMSPRPETNHNLISFNIAFIFERYLRKTKKPCLVFPYGQELWLDDMNHFVPDVMVVCDGSKVKRGHVEGAPDLAVEVLSPSTEKHDRSEKKDVYARSGVKEYWLVDPAERKIEIYMLKNGVLELASTIGANCIESSENLIPVRQFMTSIYDDLVVSVEDVFLRTFGDE